MWINYPNKNTTTTAKHELFKLDHYKIETQVFFIKSIEIFKEI